MVKFHQFHCCRILHAAFLPGRKNGKVPNFVFIYPTVFLEGGGVGPENLLFSVTQKVKFISAI